MIVDKLEREQLYNTAWKHWGANMQVDILIEEMSELTQALLKARRYGDVFSRDVYEEIADVSICLEQIEAHLTQFPRASANHFVGDNGNKWNNVLDVKESKLVRLKERLMQSMTKKLEGDP